MEYNGYSSLQPIPPQYNIIVFINNLTTIIFDQFLLTTNISSTSKQTSQLIFQISNPKLSTLSKAFPHGLNLTISDQLSIKSLPYWSPHWRSTVPIFPFMKYSKLFSTGKDDRKTDIQCWQFSWRTGPIGTSCWRAWSWCWALAIGIDAGLRLGRDCICRSIRIPMRSFDTCRSWSMYCSWLAIRLWITGPSLPGMWPMTRLRGSWNWSSWPRITLWR